ncbi:PQQ-dependent sugar dehydrogenase [Flavihumibacter profundi]|uniref:PQQ-dependent sugar dehydrogenase n=1 Tax=Flavihumibacter profundi TaxID=2716883 RepID=UPI001CC78869|nr:PQQ-dependent sugar dehydrogenase [Flavihumibacter profundi]MBZ5859322.1 PQQ-dependent sugar dehydrogenase [Flavihumibacter profundi]
MKNKRQITTFNLCSFALFLLSMAFTQCKQESGLPKGDPDNGGLSLPGHFEAVVVVDSIGPARHIAVNSNGDIYVKLRSVKLGNGGNVALRDIDHDGKADSIVNFGIYDTDGSLANCMRIHNGYLYFGSELVIYRQKLKSGQLVPDSKMEVVFTDDHKHGVHWHITKPIAFDDKGHLYIPFGAPSNACQDLIRTPGGTPGIAGLDPCPELEQHGGIWQFDANKTGLTQKDGRKFATGLRSIVAMDWNRDDKNLYTVMHGRDDLHLLWPDKYTPWQSAVLPSEEFLRVKDGDNFGWPYSYYDQMQEKNILAPEYGGDGKIPARDSSVQKPLIGFPAHWAPNDLLFYEGDQFPERYKHGAFIAFHGSTNRTPYPQAGYFICFVPFNNGAPSGPWEVFADGFAGIDTIVNVSDAKFRPMGLAMGPDGSLYVTDSRVGKIWRIMYKGDKKDFGPGQLVAMEKRKENPNIRTPDEIKDNLFKEKGLPGSQVYNFYCQSCHQHNGKGDGSRFPPLENSDWVTGNKGRLISVLLNGLNQPIVVNGKTYNSLMPQHSFLKDNEIAQVLTYIKKHFNQSKDSVSAEEVKTVRIKTSKQ